MKRNTRNCREDIAKFPQRLKSALKRLIKDNSHKLFLCCLFVIIGTFAALFLANLINDAFTHRSLSERNYLNIFSLIDGALSNEQPRKLFWIFETMAALVCFVYFFSSLKPYQAEMYQVTPKIEIPKPYGQKQHGSAWFMPDEEKARIFPAVVLFLADDKIKRLLAEGLRRAEAVDNGQYYHAKPIGITGNIFDEAGIVLGRNATAIKEQISCITDDVHTMTIGSTGCGKTRTLVLQTLCALALAGEGIVVSDPKGELYHYMHTFLETFGYTVCVIDFNSPRKSMCYNPLQPIIDAVNRGEINEASEKAWDMVNILVEKSEKGEPIWTNGEMAIIVASILAVVYDNQDCPEYQNLTNVYEFISNMSVPAQGEKEIQYKKYLRSIPDNHPARQTLAIANVAPDKTAASFYTSALTTLRLFTNPTTYRITSKSDFDLASFGTEAKKALFYVLPDERETFYPITTILVAQQYELLVVAAKKTGNRLRYRVNFVLDEFGNFSKIETFEKKLTVSRGYGIRWNLFLQSFAQLKLVYGEEVANIAKGNCRYWIYLQSTDIETNKELSEAMGKYTTLTYSLGSSAQKYSNPSSSVNVSLIERSLLTAEEIMNGFERPYSLVISNNSPAVMESPDISKWAFNDMLGLGDKKHNQRLIELDENARPSYDGEIEIKLWKPWLELAAKTRKAVNAENEGHNSMF